MTGTYQAVYDAVRSKISNGDIGGAVADVARQNFDISHYMQSVAQEFQIAAHEMQRPSVLFKPVISLDGDHYCVLLGQDLMNGVAGFGKTVSAAMLDFDNNFVNQEAQKVTEAKCQD